MNNITQEEFDALPRFKQNITKWKLISTQLATVELEYSHGVILDTSLPSIMHRIVCHIDKTQMTLDQCKTILNTPEMQEYLGAGRQVRISAFFAEQDKAREWQERAIL
jgi:hypothetical protein